MVWFPERISDTPGLKIGDEVEVMVIEKEDREGHLNLSRRQARITRAWERSSK